MVLAFDHLYACDSLFAFMVLWELQLSCRHRITMHACFSHADRSEGAKGKGLIGVRVYARGFISVVWSCVIGKGILISTVFY